jgi:hypothetical protein
MDKKIEIRNTNDPGDQVLRKFEYQHAYGVILSTRMILEQDWNCKTLWCEHHEDLLVEFNNGTYAAYQVKTKKAETGYWKISDESFVKSLSRFIEEDSKFPNKITEFFFVSNAEYSDSGEKRSEHFSPIKLLKAVEEASTHEDLPDKALQGFNFLKNVVGCDETKLFEVLNRLDLVVGPGEKSFEEEITIRHIANLSQCTFAGSAQLNKVREALTRMVANAAILSANTPSRDWVGLTKANAKDPYLESKKVTRDLVKLTIGEALIDFTCFPADLFTIDLPNVSKKSHVLEQKMNGGGIGSRYDVMQRRSMAAERHLLDRASRGSDTATKEMSQIENVVFGECDEAHLRTSKSGSTFGAPMLIDVQERLKAIAKDEPSRVGNAPYEVLVGVSAMLTSECKVWWSDKFDIEDSE